PHSFLIFFVKDPATSLIYTLSLHDALPILFMPAGNGLNSPYPAQVFNLAPSVGRYVRLEVTAGPSFAVSMGEIAFDVTPLAAVRSEEHTSELQSRENLVCRLLLEKKKE